MIHPSLTKFLFLYLVLSAAQCQRPVDEPPLPLELFRRSVLDQKVRMITLQYAGLNFLSYDLQNMQPYKFWTGGVRWEGAAFNNVKTVQPASFGLTYWQNKDSLFWTAESHGKMEPATAVFESYEITADSQINFYYQLQFANQTIAIQESPRVLRLGDSVRFERRFTMDINDPISVKAGTLPLTSSSVLSQTFFIQPAPPPPPVITSDDGAQYWLDRSGCNTCHEINEKSVGPAYTDIARKYPATSAIISTLSSKVRHGSSGTWGSTPMIPHPHLLETDVNNMVKYILSLKPDASDDRNTTSISSIAVSPRKPGFGAPVKGIHPSYDLVRIRPDHFRPRVGAMAMTSAGDLLVSTWDSIGAVFKLSGLALNDTSKIKIKRIASGLAEPLGLSVVGDQIFVLQKQELTELIDDNSDGVTDRYRCVDQSFGVTADFHEFSYGLVHHQGQFFGALGLAMRLMSTEQQLEDRGTVFSLGMNQPFTVLARGLRQPNGIGLGPEGALFVTENQGQWVPACKLIEIERDSFYGCQFGTGDRFKGRLETLPAVYLPQDEIGNSPTQPLWLRSGPYAGQMLVGDVTQGGIQRICLEKIKGRYQGAVLRFTQGLEAGINRLVVDPAGHIYAGGVGMNGGWAHQEHQYGLQKLVPNSRTTFEILDIRLTPTGFALRLTSPLHARHHLDTSQIHLNTWYYQATPNYGGPKLNHHTLTINDLKLSADRQEIILTVPGIQEGYVVYFLLSDQWTDQTGHPMWSGEAWYTLKNILP